MATTPSDLPTALPMADIMAQLQQMQTQVVNEPEEEDFIEAVRYVNEKKSKVEFPEETQKKLYGLFMVAKHGEPPPTPENGMTSEQHEAWCEAFGAQENVLEPAARTARRAYVELVEATDPSFLLDEEEEEETPAAPPPAPKDAPLAASIFDAVQDGGDVTPFLPSQANAVDESQLSALHHAVDAEHVEAVKALLAAGASPDAVDDQNATPLHYAALLGSAPITSLLLEAGAAPAPRDADGKTPARLALGEGYEEVAQQILAAVAAPAKAEGLLPGRLPTIDLHGWLHGSNGTREAVATAFDQALQEWGFCQVRGYEELLQEATLREMREHAHAFFAQPTDAKRACHVDGVIGYLGAGDETVAASAGGGGAPDPVESLNLPAYQEKGVAWHAAQAEAECPWRDASYVPSTPPSFRETAIRCFGGFTRIMMELHQLMEVALNLPPHHLQVPCAQPGTLLRFAHYPPVAPVAEAGGDHDNAPQLRYGEHTDFDGFTILQRDGDSAEDGGLEIQLRDGSWASVPSVSGTLTINIGDLFARWTNDRWRATKHRVAPSKAGAAAAPGKARLSLVYFTGP